MAGHRLGALEGGGGVPPPLPMHRWPCPTLHAPQVLQILTPLHCAGLDTAPGPPSLLARDATGRPCILTPEPDLDAQDAPAPPILLVTDTSSCIPALMVTGANAAPAEAEG